MQEVVTQATVNNVIGILCIIQRILRTVVLLHIERRQVNALFQLTQLVDKGLLQITRGTQLQGIAVTVNFNIADTV